MITQITGNNVPRAYHDGLWQLKISGVRQATRNGEVLSIPTPVLLTIKDPLERVLFDPLRDANPFFHVMEFCWMMAGSNDAKWISQFNKRMMEYADDGTLRGAYGYRWKHGDQIRNTILLLQKEPGTRQAVISMWDPILDGRAARTSDRPCNTHIYFRMSPSGMLDMTVCNRSNDFIWGMLGANAVHMTLLHELVSFGARIPLGKYSVFSNNVHVYIPFVEKLVNNPILVDRYPLNILPLLQNGEDWMDIIDDCEHLVKYGTQNIKLFKTKWMIHVAANIFRGYLDRDRRDQHVSMIQAEDWRIACQEWSKRR